MKKRAKKNQTYDYGTHEAMHTAYVCLDTWCDHVQEHPRVQENKAWAAQAQKAIDEMYTLYAMIGSALGQHGSPVVTAPGGDKIKFPIQQ